MLSARVREQPVGAASAAHPLGAPGRAHAAGSAVTITAQLADAYGNAVATISNTVALSSTNGGSLSSAMNRSGREKISEARL